MIDLARVTYRAARVEDAEAVSDFVGGAFCATFQHLYRPQDLATFLEKTYRPHIQRAEIEDSTSKTRVAFLNDAMIGCCQIGEMSLPFDAGSRRALELYRLYVAEEVKGAGVAAALMDWSIAEARARGAEDFYLGVWAENARAQRFYTRYGFEIVGSYLFPVGEARDDERIMRLKLS